MATPAVAAGDRRLRQLTCAQLLSRTRQIAEKRAIRALRRLFSVTEDQIQMGKGLFPSGDDVFDSRRSTSRGEVMFVARVSFYPEVITVEVRFRFDTRSKSTYEGPVAETNMVLSAVRVRNLKRLDIETLPDSPFFPLKVISREQQALHLVQRFFQSNAELGKFTLSGDVERKEELAVRPRSPPRSLVSVAYRAPAGLRSYSVYFREDGLVKEIVLRTGEPDFASPVSLF